MLFHLIILVSSTHYSDKIELELNGGVAIQSKSHQFCILVPKTRILGLQAHHLTVSSINFWIEARSDDLPFHWLTDMKETGNIEIHAGIHFGVVKNYSLLTASRVALGGARCNCLHKIPSQFQSNFCK